MRKMPDFSIGFPIMTITNGCNSSQYFKVIFLGCRGHWGLLPFSARDTVWWWEQHIFLPWLSCSR